MRRVTSIVRLRHSQQPMKISFLIWMAESTWSHKRCKAAIPGLSGREEMTGSGIISPNPALAHLIFSRPCHHIPV